MQCKVFALRLDHSLSADLAALNVFLNAVDVSFMEQGLVQGSPAFWSVLVFYENLSSQIQPVPSSDEAALNLDDSILDGAPPEERDPVEAKIYEALRQWRSVKAKEEQVPVYIVAPNKLLDEITQARPTSRGDLETLKGFGPKRLEKYGEELLALLQNLTK